MTPARARPMKPPFPKVRVTWYDAFTVDEWTSLTDYKITPTKCVTEGLLIREDELYIAVAPTISRGEDGSWDACHFINIPRGMILATTRKPRRAVLKPAVPAERA